MDNTKSKTTTDHPSTTTTQERKLATACEREYCYTQTPYPVTVTVEDTEVTWCPECVHDQFGLDYAEYQQRQQTLLRYCTVETVAAFTLGAILMLLIASVMVV